MRGVDDRLERRCQHLLSGFPLHDERSRLISSSTDQRQVTAGRDSGPPHLSPGALFGAFETEHG